VESPPSADLCHGQYVHSSIREIPHAATTAVEERVAGDVQRLFPDFHALGSGKRPAEAPLSTP